MDCMYTPLKCTHGLFLLKKSGFLGLPPVSSGTTAVRKAYFKVRLKTERKFPRIAFFFSSHKKLLRVVTMALKPFTRHKKIKNKPCRSPPRI